MAGGRVRPVPRLVVGEAVRPDDDLCHNPDWRQLILDLRRCGMSGRDLARRLGVSEFTIYQYTRGVHREPGYCFGAALVRLHEQVTGKVVR